MVRAPLGLPLDTKAEELEPLLDVDDHRLVDREPKPHGRQRRCDVVLERFGVSLGSRDHHDKIVGVTHEAIRRVAVLAAGSALGTTGHVALPYLGEVIVED